MGETLYSAPRTAGKAASWAPSGTAQLWGFLLSPGNFYSLFCRPRGELKVKPMWLGYQWLELFSMGSLELDS